MKRIIITLCLVLVLATPAHAGEWFTWDETNTKLHVPLTVLMIVDLGQTLWIADNCNNKIIVKPETNTHYADWKWEQSETNSLLGRCPTRTKVKQHFGWFYVALTGLIFASPSELSYTIQGSAITVELYYVGRNISLNIGIGF
jgi:hypothetical protein